MLKIHPHDHVGTRNISRGAVFPGARRLSGAPRSLERLAVGARRWAVVIGAMRWHALTHLSAAAVMFYEHSRQLRARWHSKCLLSVPDLCPGWQRCAVGWILLLVVGLCMLAAQGTADDGKPAGSTTLVALGDADQSSFSLPILDGPAHELARLRGRVVLVHFFATWCEPCRAEMASLRQLQSRLDGRPFAIVPISVAEADGTVRRFFADDPLPFAILLDRARSVARAWNIHTLPSTVVLDRALKSRFIAEGDVDWARSDVLNLLADLLMEVPG